MLKVTYRIKKPTLRKAASALLISLYCVGTGSAAAGGPASLRQKLPE